MKLKLKEAIVANNVQYLPPAVIDVDEIGITTADAEVLVRRGTASVFDEAAPEAAPAADAPEVISVDQPEDAPAPAAKPAARKR
jgi:hypothetical protein